MGLRILLVHALLLLPLGAVAQPISGIVSEVIDGDTVVLATGEHVRLLDINTPEKARDGEPAQAGADAATAGLRAMILGKAVTLKYGPKERDVYNRLLAHLYLPDGTWVNGAMVEQGLAHVYTFADNHLMGEELIAKEDTARAKGLGLWAMPRWQVVDAAKCCTDEEIGRYELVRGTVVRVGSADGRTYLNFGKNWKTDFTVFIAKKDEKWFKKAGIKDLNIYQGKTVLVRGFTQPVNGVLMHATHPEQLEIVK